MQTIPVVVEAGEEEEKGTLGVLTPGKPGKGGSKIKNLDVERLRESMAGLAENASTIFKDIKQVGGFRLREVQLQVEITAEGGVALVGIAKAGVKGAVSLTFREE